MPFFLSLLRRHHPCQLYKLLPLRTITTVKDTIYSLSSGKSKCGVAVIRVSGPSTKDIMMKMGAFTCPPKPRTATLRTILDNKSKERLDSGLILWFPSPQSFTGEDCLELHVHGGVAVVSAVLTSLGKFPSTRQAEPGEFTKRSFLNGKLDITEVEGLADVIHSETEVQRKQAYRQMTGELSALYNNWRDIMIRSCAHVEAYIDFSEEENIEDDVISTVMTSIADLISQLESYLTDGRRGERLRDGVHVAVLGRPNVGKSSLMNYLTKRPVAIVSDVEGTTRDLIESTLDINGYPVVVVDTAGLRETGDKVEKEGVARAISRSELCDLLIIMVDISEDNSSDSILTLIGQQVHQLLDQHFQAERDLKDKSLLIVVNKVDKLDSPALQSLTCRTRGAEAISDSKNISDSSAKGRTTSPSSVQDVDSTESGILKVDVLGSPVPVVFTSLTHSIGLHHFLAELTQLLAALCADPTSECLSVTQARHRTHLDNCLDFLREAIESLDTDVVVAAENLRLASGEIGRITGRISTEDILDVIFKEFCIGK